MQSFLLVALGGALGAGLRYATGLAVGNGASATLIVNVSGSFLLGLLTAWGAYRDWPGEQAIWLLVGVGMLGAFTTFSTFSRETIYLFLEGPAWRGIAYMLVNLIGSVGAFAVALFTLKRLLS